MIQEDVRQHVEEFKNCKTSSIKQLRDCTTPVNIFRRIEQHQDACRDLMKELKYGFYEYKKHLKKKVISKEKSDYYKSLKKKFDNTVNNLKKKFPIF